MKKVLANMLRKNSEKVVTILSTKLRKNSEKVVTILSTKLYPNKQTRGVWLFYLKKEECGYLCNHASSLLTDAEFSKWTKK